MASVGLFDAFASGPRSRACYRPETKKQESPDPENMSGPGLSRQWRGEDLNLRPSGYEPDELPDCSTPR